MVINNWQDCLLFLNSSNAPPRLIKHLEIVSSVAKEMSEYFLRIDVKHNQSLVICGAGLHDVGKIFFENELSEHGNKHEEKGKEFLLSKNVSVDIANCCVSHAKWESTEKLEELFVALADKLWKGHRNSNLELKVIDLIAKAKNTTRWKVFPEIDMFFETIANDATTRLENSKLSTLKM